MARGKKKESALAPEEKLAQALVPDWEQPYKVPGNWKWIILGNLVEIRRGASPRPIKAYVTEDETGVNWIKIGDTDSGKYITHIAEKITSDGAKKSVFVEEGTLLLSNSMSFGRPYILKVNGCIHDGWLAITPSAAFNKEYLYYALLASEWYFEQVAVGTAVRNLNSERVAGTPVPCPPLAEQQRIVDHIEYLFAKLDEAKEKAQSVLDSVETRKAAILHKAFTGELTAKWRAEHGVGLDTWKHHAFRELCTDIVRGGSPRPAGSPEFYDGPIPFMKVADITRNNSPYVSSAEYSIKEAGLKKTRMVSANTLLLTNSGATLGVPAICTFETTFNDGIAAFLGLPEDTLLFYYYFWASKTSDLRAINKGAAQPNLNTTIIGDVEIDVPSDPEKHEIVRILESLFMKEEQAKEAAEAVLEKIDLLKKSILACAFRGELGTNDPTEESALELLKNNI